MTLDTSGNGCILVRFTANILVVDNGDTSQPAPAAQFKASVGGEQMKPGVLLFTDTGSVLYTTFAGEWWKCGLAGNGTSHNIKIKYRRRAPQSDDDTVQIRERTLVAELN